jgi:hypothetical protein
MRQRVVAVVMLASLAVLLAPAWAGDRPVASEWGSSAVVLSPPADTGKPLLPGPPAAAGAGEPERCVSPLPCGTRLLGTVRKDGAVEVQVPALRW